MLVRTAGPRGRTQGRRVESRCSGEVKKWAAQRHQGLVGAGE